MKLTDLKVIYICPDHNEKYHQRKVHMDSLLKTIGFTDIVHYKSGTEAYPVCLVNATIAVLKANMDTPFLLLEDDVEFTKGTEFNLPSETDAIYFGLSKYGDSSVNTVWDGMAKFAPFSSSQVRVLNMLGGHAICYVSQKYKQAVIDILSQHIGTPYYNDVLMSRIQSKYVVLAQKRPFFYQSNKFNTENLEKMTKFNLL
jgi:hypothetical protein